jgi:hypothetical protein
LHGEGGKEFVDDVFGGGLHHPLPHAFSPSIPAAQGIKPSFPLMSAPVSTSMTPASALAPDVSMDLIRAWVCTLRTKAMRSMPRSFRSSTECARPWMSRGSSLSLMRSPRILAATFDPTFDF